jgi:hypothetical protein
LEHHAVGSLYLAIAPWVSDRVVDVDEVILAEVPEDRASEGYTQVGDDPIGHTEAMFYVSDEFNCFFRRYFRNRSDLNSLGEFVYSNHYMFVAVEAVQNGPTASRPHIAMGHDGGIVRRT